MTTTTLQKPLGNSGQTIQQLLRGTDFDNILTCVHCGLCLDNCPTYRELHDEKESPRGRLYLMRGLYDGELDLTEEIKGSLLDRCLGCRACETACPSGVPYGELLEKARGVIHETSSQGVIEQTLRTVLLKGLFRSTFLLSTASKLLKLYALTGLPKLITNTALGKILPKSFVFQQHLLPDCSGRSFKKQHAQDDLQAVAGAKSLGRVGLFTGCVMDVSEAAGHCIFTAEIASLQQNWQKPTDRPLTSTTLIWSLPTPLDVVLNSRTITIYSRRAILSTTRTGRA